MSKLIRLDDAVWEEVCSWDITPMPTNYLDRNFMTLNHDDRDGYFLISENLMETKGLTCLEFHIFIRLRPDGNSMEEALMLDLPFIIYGPGGPTQRQLEAEPPETKLYDSAPIEYLDQPKVLKAILSLEEKGLVIINRNDA